LEINKELIVELVGELRSKRSGLFLYQQYYEGKHDIVRSYAMQEARSNIKVVCNFPKKFIEEEISYTLANPVNYISSNDDVTVLDNIDLAFSTWEKVHNIELLKQALIFGEAYELNYINQEGEFRAAVYSPRDMLIVENETVDKSVIIAIHLFTKNSLDDTEFLDVYIGKRIYHYEVDLGYEYGLKELGEDSHIFNGVPVSVCKANLESMSMIDDIKTLNDSYNNVLSDLVNEVSDFRNAFLTIVGAELEKDDVGRLKEEGIIQIPKDAKVDFLIKNINDSFVQGLLTTLEKKIYQMASHIDTNEKIQANTSSLALRSRLISLENKCSLLQAMLEMTIRERLKRFFAFLKVQSGVDYDYRRIKLKFTSNVPTDLAVTAQVITQLQNTISQETALSLLPFVENPKLELERYLKEQERYGESLLSEAQNESA